MKKLLVGLSLSATLLLVACGTGTQENTNETVSAEQPQENLSQSEWMEQQSESTEPSEQQQEAEVGSRTNPVPVGEALVATTEVISDNGEAAPAEFTISLSNFIRGEEAMNYLLEQNQFNEEPPEGYEWMLFDVSLNASIENPNIPHYPMPTFSVIDASGSPVSQNGMYATMDSQFGYVDVYDGGEATGKAAVVVPTDGEVLVEYSDFGIQAFFETE